MTTGERIRKARQQAGMSQETAAEKIKVSRQTLSNWERDKTLPDSESIANMSKVYSVSTDTLLTGYKPEQIVIPSDKTAAKIRKAIFIISAINVLLSRIIVYFSGNYSQALIWISVLCEFGLVFITEFNGIPSSEKGITTVGKILLKTAVAVYFILILIMTAATFNLIKLKKVYAAMKIAAGATVTAVSFYIVFIHRYINRLKDKQ